MRDRQNQHAAAVARQRGNEPPERNPAPGGRPRRRPQRADPSVNMDQLRELIALIRENGLAEFELEQEGFRVRLRREIGFGEEEDSAGTAMSTQPGSRARPVMAPAKASSLPAAAAVATVPSHPGARAETAASEDQDLHIITSPIVGTFYRAASPNAEPFVKIGAQVEADTVVCIIEAMKLMNEILAEASGEIVKIYVENGQPVEYGQPLFGIKR